MGLTVAVVALALTDRGIDLVQISLLFGVYALTTMTMELPFGGLADNIGRKPVFLAAVVASLMSLALFLSSNDFHVLALSFAFIGFGHALRSGTLDAWFVETFKAAAPGVDVQPALARAHGASSKAWRRRYHGSNSPRTAACWRFAGKTGRSRSTIPGTLERRRRFSRKVTRIL